MIVARIQGGMSNQQFEYAMAYSLAKSLGAPLELELGHFRQDPMRQYSLGLWKGVNEPLHNYMPHNVRLFKEQGLPYNPGLLEVIRQHYRQHGRTAVEGYWQCEEYFKDCRQELQGIFLPRRPYNEHGLGIQRHMLGQQNSVFMTIRRTDYLTSTFHGVLGMDYYRTALAQLGLLLDGQPFFVYVFSDDPEWCKAHLPVAMPATVPYIVAGNYDATTAAHLGREDQELMLMASCRHAICANSSYSWWGSWLGADSRLGGITIAPKQWFLSTLEDSKDICPSRWIRI